MKRVWRHACLLPLLGLAATSSCSSVPAHEEPRGIRTEVSILGGGFVRFEDERVPMETFLLEVRVRVRNADGDAEQLPWVVIDVAPEVAELTGQAMVQRLMEGLRAAGVADISAGAG